ncbi:HEPN domain-containing protein [Priestia flexa]|uniref:HEPN domain-containing protein n=1 Tax=Priestia flexa TaxID=86664 RepID=UPI00077CA679|nr:HEPN domain-containing protein [Priestia flexa]MED4587681.1 HEPN domain-containing protein [Priestia flexa]
MKKLKLKYEAIVYGLQHMEKDYSVDEFAFKLKPIDLKKYAEVFNANPYLANPNLFNWLIQFEGDEKHYYCCFENDEPIEIEVSNKIGDSKGKIKKYVEKNVDELCNKVLYLEKVLRLVTNLDIHIPLINFIVYDEKMEFVVRPFLVRDFSPLDHASRFSEKNWKLQTSRLNLHINWGLMTKIMSGNKEYIRALDYFNESFSVNKTPVKLLCLFASLESLFNYDKEKIAEKVSTYTSKLFFDKDRKDEIYSRIKKLYDERSKYIHGTRTDRITYALYDELKEFVRVILLNYWFVSMYHEVKDNSQMISFLDEEKPLNINTQFAIRAIKETDYTKFYSDVREKLESGVTDIF